MRDVQTHFLTSLRPEVEEAVREVEAVLPSELVDFLRRRGQQKASVEPTRVAGEHSAAPALSPGPDAPCHFQASSRDYAASIHPLSFKGLNPGENSETWHRVESEIALRQVRWIPRILCLKSDFLSSQPCRCRPPKDYFRSPNVRSSPGLATFQRRKVSRMQRRGGGKTCAGIFGRHWVPGSWHLRNLRLYQVNPRVMPCQDSRVSLAVCPFARMGAHLRAGACARACARALAS